VSPLCAAPHRFPLTCFAQSHARVPSGRGQDVISICSSLLASVFFASSPPPLAPRHSFSAPGLSSLSPPLCHKLPVPLEGTTPLELSVFFSFAPAPVFPARGDPKRHWSEHSTLPSISSVSPVFSSRLSRSVPWVIGGPA